MKQKAPGGSGIALSIVIPTYNRHSLLRGAIASVERQTLHTDAFELIVVDNSSDRDAQADFLNALSVDCRCDYAVEDIPGAARARNIGMRLGRGEVVAFLDDDAVADPGWAEAILGRFAASPGIGVLGGPVVPIWPAERPAWLPRWADDHLSILDHGPAPRAVRPDEQLISANMAFPRAALDRVGGFPEHLGRRGSSLLSNEDLAVRRAVEAGGSPAFYDPRVKVRHHIASERLSQAWLRRRMAWQVVSDVIEAGDDIASEGSLDRTQLRRLLDFGFADPGLIGVSDDPDAVTRQMQAVCLLLRCLLVAPGRPPAA